jgi:sulfhydrogenase subunit gamma (sulfur reductase)
VKSKEIYLPTKAEIVEVIDMTSDIKLFKIKPDRPFHYQHGQFLMLSLWGKGEVPISITSTYSFHEYIELCIRRVGYITSAMHKLNPPFKIGLRGPFGNVFPIENAENKDVLFVAGGLGIAPLRPLITMVMNRKKHFRRVALIYGSRNPSEILFKNDIDSWQKKGMHIILTVDRKDRGWDGNVGLVKEYLDRPKISFKNARAFICGPPIMIKVTMNGLAMMGMNENNIFTSLEAHMKCGVGKCGHCYTGGKYICTDGPIFSCTDIKKYNLYSP